MSRRRGTIVPTFSRYAVISMLVLLRDLLRMYLLFAEKANTIVTRSSITTNESPVKL